MQANGAMRELLRSTAGRARPPSIPADIASAFARGFVREGECVFLRSLYDLKGNGTRDRFRDDVGYECFVNHIHVEDSYGAENLQISLCLIEELRAAWLLHSGAGEEKLRVIVSCDDDGGCVFRFHRVRPTDEPWLDPDLESCPQPVLTQYVMF